MAETVLLVRFVVSVERAEAFDAAVRRNACASLRDEPGCRQFDVCRNPQDARQFLLYERYADDAAVAAHRASPHYRAMQVETAGWFESIELTEWRRKAD